MSCCSTGATGWRPLCLYRGGGRANEPDLLALHAATLRSGPSVPGVGTGAVHGVSGPGPAHGAGAAPQKRGPTPRWSDAELLDRIRAVLAVPPFLGEGHRKVWARLRWQGVRTSKARVLRLMRGPSCWLRRGLAMAT